MEQASPSSSNSNVATSALASGATPARQQTTAARSSPPLSPSQPAIGVRTALPTAASSQGEKKILDLSSSAAPALPPASSSTAGVAPQTTRAEGSAEVGASSTDVAAAAPAVPSVPVTRNGMYPASRRRVATTASAAAAASAGSSGSLTHPSTEASSGGKDGAGTLEDGSALVHSPTRSSGPSSSTRGLPVHTFPYKPSLGSPSSTSPQRLQIQLPSHTHNLSGNSPRAAGHAAQGGRVGAASHASAQQPTQSYPSLAPGESSENASASFGMGSSNAQQQQQQRHTAAVSSPTSNAGGNDASGYPPYSNDTYAGEPGGDNAATYYQQYCQYYQYQMQYQQAQQPGSSAGNEGAFPRTNAGNTGSHPGSEVEGPSGGTGGQGYTGYASSPMMPYTTGHGQAGGNSNSKRSYYNAAADQQQQQPYGSNYSAQSSTTYAHGGGSSGGRGHPASYGVHGQSLSNASASGAAGFRHDRSASRADSVGGNVNTSSVDLASGYGGGAGGGLPPPQRSLSSSELQSFHHVRSAGSAEYDGQGGPEYYNYYNSGNGAGPTGGYGDYYNPTTHYGYNGGHGANAALQHQNHHHHHQQQQQYSREHMYSMAPQQQAYGGYGSYGAAPYADPYGGYAQLSSAAPTNQSQPQQQDQQRRTGRAPPASLQQYELQQPYPAPQSGEGKGEKELEKDALEATAKPEYVTEGASDSDRVVSSALAAQAKTGGGVETKSALRKKRKQAAAAAAAALAAEEEVAKVGDAAPAATASGAPRAPIHRHIDVKAPAIREISNAALEASMNPRLASTFNSTFTAGDETDVEGADNSSAAPPRCPLQLEETMIMHDPLLASGSYHLSSGAQKPSEPPRGDFKEGSKTAEGSADAVNARADAGRQRPAISGGEAAGSDVTSSANVSGDGGSGGLPSGSSGSFAEQRSASTNGGAHNRSASHGSGTQRFLRHSPLAQCIGAQPFHTYLCGAMVGQAAHLQPLAPSAAATEAASIASAAASTSQPVPSMYVPVQKLLNREAQQHRAASAGLEKDEKTKPRSPHGSRGSCEGSEEGEALAESVRGTVPKEHCEAAAVAPLAEDLLATTAASPSVSEARTSSPGGDAANSPASSPRSTTAARPHHMHLFARHSVHRRPSTGQPDSPMQAMLPQHLHAYRHSSPSLQPVALATGASAGAINNPYAQSPASIASLPPRSPAGNISSTASPPPLRARVGAGVSAVPTAAAGPAAPTAAATSPTTLAPYRSPTSTGTHATAAGATATEGTGAAATMQQHQKLHIPPRTLMQGRGVGGGWAGTAASALAEGRRMGHGEAYSHSGGDGSYPVSPYLPAPQHHQHPQHGDGSSGRRVGGYEPVSPSSAANSTVPASCAIGCLPQPMPQLDPARAEPVAPMPSPSSPVMLLQQQQPQQPQQQQPPQRVAGFAGSGAAVPPRTPSPRGSPQGGGGAGSVHATSPQHSRYSPRNPNLNGNTNMASQGGNGGGFPIMPQRPSYIYMHHVGPEVLVEEFHSAMGFNPACFGNIACLVDALSPQVPVAGDLELPCDEDQCQLLPAPREESATNAGGNEASLDEPELSGPGAVGGPGSSTHGSAFGSRTGAASTQNEAGAGPDMSTPPRAADADRSRYWNFDGPSYCEPVVTLKSIWQSFDNPFGCVVNLAEPIYPAPMRPAEDELVYTPLLSGFRIRFHPASAAYKRLAAIREVRHQRRREECGATGGQENEAPGSGVPDSATNSSAAYAEEDGVLTWSATDRPNNRNIIMEQITALARSDESYAELLTATSADVDHQSWIALMWQPVFCGGHSAKHSCGTFLAFYLLRAPRHLFVPFASKSEGAAMNSSWDSPVFRGDRAALSFDLWTLQRHYHVARWASSPPMTRVTTALSVAGEEEDNASSVSASRGRLSWEEGQIGCVSNAAESYSMSNNGDARLRPRDVASQSSVVAGLGGDGGATTYVRVPLVGLIPNRCRSEVWFKAVYDPNALMAVHRNPNAGGGGGSGSGETFCFYAPLFLMVTALQLMCWDAHNEWTHKPATPTAADADGAAAASSSNGKANEERGESSPEPGVKKGDSGKRGEMDIAGVVPVVNPLTQMMEMGSSAAAAQGGDAGRNGEVLHLNSCLPAGEEGGAAGVDGADAAAASWVSYFADGVELMTSAARQYRAVRERANLDATVEESGAAGNPPIAATIATSPVARDSGAAAAGLGEEAPSSAGETEDKKGAEDGLGCRAGGCVLVAGGTNSALCDPVARVIAGLLDYYQWAQYDTSLASLARSYCAM